MDFELNDEQRMLQETVRRYAHREIAPHVKQMDEEEKYLPLLASGERCWCMGLTEPEAGSDAISIKTRAKKVEGGYVLSGTKTFISNAPIADLALIYATVDIGSYLRGPL